MTRRLIWASAHKMTAEQQAELAKKFRVNVIELKEMNRELWERMSNIERGEEARVAMDLAEYLNEEDEEGDDMYENFLVQPAGNPKFQFELGQVLMNGYFGHLIVLYAYSERKSIDVQMEDGSVVKTSVFQHQGFE